MSRHRREYTRVQQGISATEEGAEGVSACPGGSSALRTVLWVSLHVRRKGRKFFGHLHHPEPSISHHAARYPVWNPPQNTDHPLVSLTDEVGCLGDFGAIWADFPVFPP